MPDSPALLLDGVIKSFGPTQALVGLSLRAERAQVTAVLGRNGAGKTTAIEISEGLQRHDAGTVSVLGLSPADRSLRTRVGAMPQSGGAYQAATLEQVLGLFSRLYAHPLPTDALLARLELTDLRRRLVKRLSGGEAQRLSLALALVGRPELVFLDEPTANLDVHSRHNVWELVRELRTAGVSVVLTTHNMQEAQALADHVVILDRGKAITSGSPTELLTRAEAAVTFRAESIEGLALPPSMSVTVRADGAYVVNGASTPRDLATVSQALADADITASEITLGSGGLEELFVGLTGGDA